MRSFNPSNHIDIFSVTDFLHNIYLEDFYFNTIVGSFKCYFKSPNVSEMEFKLQFCLIFLENFLEKLFFPLTESDIGYFGELIEII